MTDLVWMLGAVAFFVLGGLYLWRSARILSESDTRADTGEFREEHPVR